MYLYLVRHGEAKSVEEDPLQGLSDKGLRDVENVAAHAQKLGITLQRIFHSGKTRAFQTAQIFGRRLIPHGETREADGLAPLDNPGPWATRISAMDEDIMLVGHLPFLARLSAVLLSGDKGENRVDFKAGSLACLKKSDDGSWSMEWIVSPEVIQ
jgi:phosphohistidine phosphatase